MSEMNELTRSLVRVEDLIKNGENAGALNCLWISQNHAISAVKLISDQSKAMTEQALKIKELTERMEYWQKRAESAEADIKELDEQEPVAIIGDTYGLFWIGNEAIAPIIERNNLKVGDKLYARPVPAKSVPDGVLVTGNEQSEFIDCKIGE